MSDEIREHHPISPSTLQNREACPCYEPHGGANEAAIRGTLQHNVVETGQDDENLSDDHALEAAECLDFYERQKQILEEARDRALLMYREKANPMANLDPVLDLAEVYLPIDDCTFDEPMFNPETNQIDDATIYATTAGYVDRALVSWDRKLAILLDWKFGAWMVEDAATNLQAISYVLGVFKMFPTLETVKFYFKLPALGTMTEATFTRAQIPELYLRVQTVVARAREARKRIRESDDFSMATPMIPACNFCSNLGRCPKVLAIACKVGAKYHPIEIPEDINPTGIKSATDRTLGLRLSQVLAVWAKAFRTQETERVISRGEPCPPGFKVQTKKDREIADIKKFKEVTFSYLTHGELEELATYTFGKVEKKISATAPRGSKEATVEEYQEKLLASGAVKYGAEYSFLKGVSEK